MFVVSFVSANLSLTFIFKLSALCLFYLSFSFSLHHQTCVELAWWSLVAVTCAQPCCWWWSQWSCHLVVIVRKCRFMPRNQADYLLFWVEHHLKMCPEILEMDIIHKMARVYLYQIFCEPIWARKAWLYFLTKICPERITSQRIMVALTTVNILCTLIKESNRITLHLVAPSLHNISGGFYIPPLHNLAYLRGQRETCPPPPTNLFCSNFFIVMQIIGENCLQIIASSPHPWKNPGFNCLIDLKFEIFANYNSMSSIYFGHVTIATLSSEIILMVIVRPISQDRSGRHLHGLWQFNGSKTSLDPKCSGIGEALDVKIMWIELNSSLLFQVFSQFLRMVEEHMTSQSLVM